MRVARYWAKADAKIRTPDGRPGQIPCWRWSEESPEDARQRAEAAAQDAERRAREGAKWGYGYIDRPPREEIIEEFKGGGGEPLAIVTRNSYGSLVLNTRDLMFIDIDTPPERSFGGFLRLLKDLFGRKEADPATQLRERLRHTAERYSQYTFRLYATSAGYRCVVVNRPISPTSRECEELFSSFDADPLYVRLCATQECYRARLTPKFWRCNLSRPPWRYPWRDAREERESRQWEDRYTTECEPYSTCYFLEEYGSQPVDPELEPLVKLHDGLTGALADSPLGLA